MPKVEGQPREFFCRFSTHWWYNPKCRFNTHKSKESQNKSKVKSLTKTFDQFILLRGRFVIEVKYYWVIEVCCTCMNWKDASKSSTGYILIRKNLTPMMRLIVLWTTYGLCSFWRSSFSSAMNFFFTAGNLRGRKKQQNETLYKDMSASRNPNQHFPNKVPPLEILPNISSPRFTLYIQTASLCPSMHPWSST